MPSRRVLSSLLAVILLGTLVGIQAPATAATTRTISIAAKPAAAAVNSAVTISGVLSRSPKGSAVTIQRKVGTNWVTAKSTKTRTATGRYAASVTLPSTVGTYSYRAVAPAKGSLRAATSKVIKVFAGTPVVATFKASPKPPAAVTAGANATVSGTVKPFVTGTTVTIQKLINGTWISTGDTAKLTSKGTFFQRIQIKNGSYLRVSVPRAGRNAPGASVGAAVIANPKISSTSLPVGAQGTAYTAQLTQVGSFSGTWSVTPALPAGLSLDQDTGKITGTPTGTSNASHTFKFEQPGLVPATKSLNLTITPPVPPTITTASLNDAKQGMSYTATLTAAGNPAGTWTASPLPSGLSLVASTGVISGTPTVAGTTHVTIGFTQTSTGLSATPKALDLTVVPPPAITTASLTNGQQGTSYSATLTAAGNPAGTWTASPLPSGLSLVASTGVISGTPTVTGTTHVTIGFTQTSTGLSATPKVLDLTITPAPPVISTSFLPDANRFTPYSTQMTAVGNPPGTWSATITPSGSGFKMSAAGVLSNGFPFTTGVFQVTINFTATGNPTPAAPVTLTLTVK